MAVFPLRWQGRRRSEQLRELIEERCATWRHAWAVASAPACELGVLQSDVPVLTRAGDRWFGASSGDGHLFVRLSGNSLAMLGGQLLGLDASGAAGLAEGVGRRAMTDLARTLANAGTTPPRVELLDARPEAALSARHGVLSLAWQSGAVRAELHFDAALCDALLPRATTGAPPLSPRQDAVRGESLALDAVLDLGAAGLNDVLALRPGEVIKTAVRLDAPLQVRLPDGRRVFSGALLAEQGQRALRCTEIPQENR